MPAQTDSSIVCMCRYLNICRICGHWDKTLVTEVLWFMFVVQVALTNHVEVGFGCMLVNSPHGE